MIEAVTANPVTAFLMCFQVPFKQACQTVHASISEANCARLFAVKTRQGTLVRERDRIATDACYAGHYSPDVIALCGGGEAGAYAPVAEALPARRFAPLSGMPFSVSSGIAAQKRAIALAAAVLIPLVSAF